MAAQRTVQMDVAALLLAVDPLVTFAVETRVSCTKRKRVQAMSRTVPNDHELTQVPLFAELSRKQLRLASRLTTPLDLPAGQVLARQGSVGAEFFVVLEGVVEVVRSGDLVATRGPGSPLGEIALLGARPRTATLIAQTPVHARARVNGSSPVCWRKSPRSQTDCMRS